MRLEKDREIAILKDQLRALNATAPASSRFTSDESCPSPHVVVPWIHSITDRGDIQTTRIDRHASFHTKQALAAQSADRCVDVSSLDTPRTAPLSATTASPPLASPPKTVASTPLSSPRALAERIAAALRNPVLSLPYLHSIQFGADLVELSAHVGTALEREDRCLTLQSPTYVLGDIHGNLSDLKFFADHVWRLGFGLTAGSFLFLGDYVDRGASSLECVAYLFAHKLLHPEKVFLLRGNHETRAVNGLEAHYGTSAFLSQCRQRFGHDEGYIVWHQINHAFDRLPLAAAIDKSVFCVHGGIPRPPRTSIGSGGGSDAGASASAGMSAMSGGGLYGGLMDAIQRLPRAVSMDVLDKRFYDASPSLSMVSDLLWGDPVREDQEATLDTTTGFGRSASRGGSAVSFGTKAIDAFLSATGMSHILRAHEARADGIGIAKAARVFTIFSTSKDHGLGDDATCGCMLVERGRLLAINRSPHFGRQQQQLMRRRSIASLLPAASLVSAQSTASTRGGGSTLATSSRVVASAVASSIASTSAEPPARALLQSQSVVVRAPRRRRQAGTDNDESDSTDDEAPSPPPPARRRALSVSALDDNNQAEDP
ncbi:hypothetical protein PINS_up015156 [Pythium insidiosum]|nr:hypothetical protein PINS_up015156 [Pythium insidiosum]